MQSRGNWTPCVISQSPYPKTEAPAYAADHVWPAHWAAHTPAALQPHSETLLSNNTEKFMMFDFEGPTLFLPTPHTSSPHSLDTGFLVGDKTFPLSTQSSFINCFLFTSTISTTPLIHCYPQDLEEGGRRAAVLCGLNWMQVSTAYNNHSPFQIKSFNPSKQAPPIETPSALCRGVKCAR